VRFLLIIHHILLALPKKAGQAVVFAKCDPMCESDSPFAILGGELGHNSGNSFVRDFKNYSTRVVTFCEDDSLPRLLCSGQSIISIVDNHACIL
jgi:hypothetical protein